MLSVPQRAEHDALLGSHRQRNLAARPGARNLASDRARGGRARRRAIDSPILVRRADMSREFAPADVASHRDCCPSTPRSVRERQFWDGSGTEALAAFRTHGRSSLTANDESRLVDMAPTTNLVLLRSYHEPWAGYVPVVTPSVGAA
jgi:hypothetical protein